MGERRTRKPPRTPRGRNVPNQRVLGDLRLLGKPRVAKAAAVRLLAGMGPHVVPQVVLFDERPAAGGTAKRAVAGVQAFVVGAATFPGECLVAVLAAEGPLACVDPLVDDETALPFELLACGRNAAAQHDVADTDGTSMMSERRTEPRLPQ